MRLWIRAKCDPMALKELFFKKLLKIAPRLGASPPGPRQIQHVSQFRHLTFVLSPPPHPKNEFLVTCQHQAKACDLKYHDIFDPTKNSSFEVSDDVIACDLCPPNQNSWLRLWLVVYNNCKIFCFLNVIYYRVIVSYINIINCFFSI